MSKLKIKKPAKKKSAKKDVLKPKNTSRETIFKVWCRNNNITQPDIVKSTDLSIGCVHHLWTEGTASKSTLRLLSLVYGIDMNYIGQMVITFNTDPKITAKILNNIKPLS